MKSMNSNDFGIILTDQCKTIRLREVLRRSKKILRKAILQSEIEIEGIKTNILFSKTGNGGERFWIECLVCKRRCSVLFIHPLSNIVACRKCLRLRYRKSVKKGMIDNIS